jgi:hypothetical protein
MFNHAIIACPLQNQIETPAALRFGTELMELVRRISGNPYHQDFDPTKNYAVEKLFPQIMLQEKASIEEYLLILGVSAILHDTPNQLRPAYIDALLDTAPPMISHRALDFLFNPRTPRDYLIGLDELFDSRTCYSFTMYYKVALFGTTYENGGTNNCMRTNTQKYTHWDIVLGFLNDPTITTTLPVVLRLMLNMFEYGAADKTCLHPVDSSHRQRQGLAEINQFKATMEALKYPTKKIQVYEYTLNTFGKDKYRDITLPSELTSAIRRKRRQQTITLRSAMTDTTCFNARLLQELYHFAQEVLLAKRPKIQKQQPFRFTPFSSIEVITQARVTLCLLLNIDPATPRAEIISLARKKLKDTHPDIAQNMYKKDVLLELMAAYKKFHREQHL